MANHKSAKKAAKQAIQRTLNNRSRMNRIRTFVKKVEGLAADATPAQAQEALRSAESELMRGVSKGVIHKNTAARKVSRLTKRVKALAKAS